MNLFFTRITSVSSYILNLNTTTAAQGPCSVRHIVEMESFRPSSDLPGPRVNRQEEFTATATTQLDIVVGGEDAQR